MTLSVVVNTKNSAQTLDRTLRSVRWADEIVVMDMGSSDETLDIARGYEARIFSHPDVGYVEPARNAAVDHATGDWVLVVDSDEEIPPSLRQKIHALVIGDATAAAYYLPRQNIVFGTWYQHAGWWPDYQLRLFKKGSVQWSEVIHRQPQVSGRVDYLAATQANAVIHHNYQSIDQFLERLNRYTSIEVSHRPDKVISSATTIDAFTDELMRRLFAHQGIEGGLHGVSLSILQAIYEVVVVMKLWQKHGFPSRDHQQLNTIKSWRRFEQQLNYWIADWQVRHSRGLKQLYWRWRRRFLL